MYLSIPIYRYWVVGGFRSHSGQLSIAASKNPSVMNTIYTDTYISDRLKTTVNYLLYATIYHFLFL